jgi:hypothetical protein
VTEVVGGLGKLVLGSITDVGFGYAVGVVEVGWRRIGDATI